MLLVLLFKSQGNEDYAYINKCLTFSCLNLKSKRTKSLDSTLQLHIHCCDWKRVYNFVYHNVEFLLS